MGDKQKLILCGICALGLDLGQKSVGLHAVYGLELSPEKWVTHFFPGGKKLL